MLTIIYGDDIAKSREYYFSERSKYPDKIILNGPTLTLTDFLQATSNVDLFGNQQIIFIEDLFSKRKPSKELGGIQLSIVNSQSSIMLYESKELTPKQLKSFGVATIKHFKIPSIVFAFLESLLPGNCKNSIALFHHLLKIEDENFILFMMQRQIRMLLSLHSVNRLQTTAVDDSLKAISELSRLAPWQKGKLEKQAKTFSLEKLLILHEMLYQFELGQKTGQLSQPLNQAIDFLLASM